ncbi:type IV toxin-antitoxin system AbiEi family antitoxin [Marinospirillum perlucidum]|uniref:type IV toxin-antitoxin system AbiEi family antitoxin n=1 Tax=Marinospirillum perlucidum TaxID=1982602 RepID=UPI00138FBAE9|nr:type IV toxin-antitoxin system AbiEi family antitoxin [Marinospirillum perlucidum]
MPYKSNARLIQQCLEALNELTGQEFLLQGDQLIGADRQVRLLVEARKSLTSTTAGTLISQLQPEQASGKLLMTEYINPVLAEQFRKAGLQFVDAQGNAFIQQPDFFLFICGQKHTAKSQSQPGAFTKTGMLLVFMLLKKPALLEATYRQLAAELSISLGKLTGIMQELADQGYLTRHKQGRRELRQLHQSKQLMQTWVENYPQQLQRHLQKEAFTSDQPDCFERIDAASLPLLWGGEVAAAGYTQGYLQPQKALVYISGEQLPQLLRHARLRKIKPGEYPERVIEVVEPFLPLEKLQGKQEGLADPLLVYAELLSSLEPRNLETARKLYEHYLDTADQ